ncbi:hypothetical protein OESDEN_14812 [Oesophagostomum dentatum]|uniref:GB1/RHD3-type G domain-containing protein n=1 Tax=Oesophagostomum dentatum TaxID=61180 RepID=A0A0B1SQG2_OESDE|nr:hypothetical protein OESDEN_14812 [Oesophagostomum dentatum]
MDLFQKNDRILEFFTNHYERKRSFIMLQLCFLFHEGCVVIISVAGAFRKGKSFLLNFFLEYLYCLQKSQQSDAPLEWLTDDCQLHGFHWRAGAKRDTVGIWIWGEPIMIEAASGEMYAVLLMDTQGTFDNTSTYQQCLTIFALSTIISCVQV